MDPDLAAAYETCRRMQRRHDPTYYLATRRLPAEVRPATYALYGYVRTADQIVDGPRRPPTPEARRARLDAWERELADGLRAGRSPNPVVGALVDAGARHDLPLEELGPYMGSMRVDCAPVRIGTWEELCGYMDGSAGTVGRIMAPLLGVPRRHHDAYGQLGVAFQHANFIRDVAEDWRLDRIYLPRADRERFGVAEADLAQPTASPELRALIAHEVERARRLFAAAVPAIDATPARVRPGVRLACAVYASVLDRVEAAGYDVLGRRMGVRLARLPSALWGALRR